MDSLWVLVLLGLKTSLWALLKNISHNFMTKENRENIQKINSENNPQSCQNLRAEVVPAVCFCFCRSSFSFLLL